MTNGSICGKRRAGVGIRFCAPLLAFWLALPVMAAADNWGLGFGAPGTPPTGNTDSETLKKYNAAYMGDPGQKVLYLTFDAGYESGYTASILDTLRDKDVPAAFFIVGHYVEAAPELTRRMAKEGHTVGNHTFHHPDMSKIESPDVFLKELQSLETLYKETTGQDMSEYYRPPQGKYSPGNLKNASDLGYKTVFWSLAYVDWLTDKQPSREQAFAKLLPRTHPGAIVLLHSTSRTNMEILPELIDKWRAEGYAFGRLEDIL